MNTLNSLPDMLQSDFLIVCKAKLGKYVPLCHKWYVEYSFMRNGTSLLSLDVELLDVH